MLTDATTGGRRRRARVARLGRARTDRPDSVPHRCPAVSVRVSAPRRRRSTVGTSRALQTALDYHRAWSSNDIDSAMALVDPGIVCRSPGGPVRGVDEFRAFMGPFAATTTATRILGAFGDEETAVVLYDTETTLVPHAPGAEHLRVVDGRIVELTIVFDRLPFVEARARAAAG